MNIFYFCSCFNLTQKRLFLTFGVGVSLNPLTGKWQVLVKYKLVPTTYEVPASNIYSFCLNNSIHVVENDEANMTSVQQKSTNFTRCKLCLNREGAIT